MLTTSPYVDGVVWLGHEVALLAPVFRAGRSAVFTGGPFLGAGAHRGLNIHPRPDSSGQWIRQQRLVPLHPDPGGGFGETVAIDRGMILVADRNAAAPGTDPNVESVGVVYGFVPGRGKYVEAFQLSQPEEWPATRFGVSIAMFGTRFAVGATEFDDDGGETPNRAFVATYSRDGFVVRPLGFVQHSTVPTSIGIANNVMLVGSPLTGFCVFGTDCIGEANLYDLSRFEP